MKIPPPQLLLAPLKKVIIIRSTPIFLDGKLYHLRYDLNSVWDLEYLLPEGFNSIISADITQDLCNILLWSGLKWDSALTVLETEKIIKRESQGSKGAATVGIMKVCIDEMFQSGWYNDPKEKKEEGKGKSYTIKDLIFALEKAAYYCEYPGDPWKLTPNEINFFVSAYNDRHKNMETENNFRMGQMCAAIYNGAGKYKFGKVPWEWRDFVPHGEQTEEEMIGILFATAAALGAST